VSAVVPATKVGAARVRRAVRLALATPLAALLLVAIRLARPLVRVRLGAMRSDRIGHFALETELALCERETGIRPAPPRSLDLWYAPEPIANRALYRMWRRVMRIWPNWLMVPLWRLNERIPGGAAHVVPQTSSTCLDVHNLLDRCPPHLAFTEAEHARGRAGLAELGIGPSDRWVCVIVRDAAYTTAAFPGKDMSYHDYRNCDVEDYVEGAEAVAQRGYFVLRMGAVVARPMRSAHPRVIDYATSGRRSEFMDLYLGAHCAFCVSDGLGYYAIPAAFRRPNAYVNYSPFFMFYSSRAADLGIAKTMVDATTGRRLTLGEMGARGVAQLSATRDFAERGVRVVSNTPGEIRELMCEMVDRLEGTWRDAPGDDERQARFWASYLEVIGRQREICHGEVRSRYGAAYLRAHPDWVA
jgi:putative glycosyltransferase (TIGR04372 family)